MVPKSCLQFVGCNPNACMFLFRYCQLLLCQLCVPHWLEGSCLALGTHPGTDCGFCSCRGHAQDGIKNEINQELKSIASYLKISNPIDLINETPAFISLRDHKQDFENHPKCRLINPAKSQLGKVSKSILDNIKNGEIRAHTDVNQWRNSTDAISWFQSIKSLHCRLLPIDFRTTFRPSYLMREAIY